MEDSSSWFIHFSFISTPADLPGGQVPVETATLQFPSVLQPGNSKTITGHNLGRCIPYTRLERGESWTRARRAGWVGRRMWSQIRKILGHPPSIPFTPAQARRGAGERSPPLRDKSCGETEVQRREGRCPRSLIARARLPFS